MSFINNRVLKITVLIIVFICIVCLCYSYLHTKKTDVNNAIVIQYGIKLKSLMKPITKAYLCLSQINYISSIFPITKYFSHWMIMVKTSDDNYYMLSTSPKHYIEILNPNYDGYTKHNLYIYQNKEYYFSVAKVYNDIPVKINVLDYANKIIKEYIKRGKYTLFSTNCQYLTSYGLKNVLHVKHKGELDITYNKFDILSELWEKRHDFINLSF